VKYHNVRRRRGRRLDYWLRNRAPVKPDGTSDYTWPLAWYAWTQGRPVSSIHIGAKS
jgi:hypothetical protein